MTVFKSESKKETEDSKLLEGLKKILVTISGTNTENITTLLTSLKDFFKTDESSTAAPATVAAGRMTKLTKPAMVPSWSRNMLLDTFVKQLELWKEINDKVPEFVKFHDFI